MQDFTKQVIKPNPLNKPQQDKWLNKDRFWTFAFWLLMTLGFSVSIMICGMIKEPKKYSYWSSVLLYSTIIGVPILLKIFNGTKFIKTITFANSEGKILTEEQRPYSFGWTIFAGLPTAFVVVELLVPGSDITFISMFVMWGCFFAPVSLYFIYKNCPISILFNSKFWSVEGSIDTAHSKKFRKIMKEEEED